MGLDRKQLDGLVQPILRNLPKLLVEHGFNVFYWDRYRYIKTPLTEKVLELPITGRVAFGLEKDQASFYRETFSGLVEFLKPLEKFRDIHLDLQWDFHTLRGGSEYVILVRFLLDTSRDNLRRVSNVDGFIRRLGGF